MFNEREFNAQLARKGIKKAELAEYLGMTYTNLYRKIRDDGKFTREEMGKIIELLDIKDPASIFFAETLTQT